MAEIPNNDLGCKKNPVNNGMRMKYLSTGVAGFIPSTVAQGFFWCLPPLQVLPRLSKDVFTAAPPWPQSARLSSTVGATQLFGAVVGCRNVGEEDMFGAQFPVVDDESGIFGG